MKIKNLWVIAILNLILSSCGGDEGLKNVTAEDFLKVIKDNAEIQIIDVRTPEEYASSIIEGAVNIPINSPDFESQISQLDKNTKTLVYCLSGARSAAAANSLQQMGFKEVYNLEGGILSWQTANLPLSKAGQQNESSSQGLNMESFLEMTKGNKAVLVDFYAEWCGPCKQMEPTLNEIASENPETVKLIRIDVDQNPQLAQALQIESIPFFQIYKNEKLTWQTIGTVAKETLTENLK